ncbi:MAG: glycosyltransferase family 4 protein [Proteobacteria bacterium]|nr:glycosyltransferase family 4 protein [Pseudomonadota bacterium]
MDKQRLLMLVGEEGHFRAHLLPIARAALARGFEVHVALSQDKDVRDLEPLGIKVYPVPLNRKSMNPLTEIKLLWAYVRLVGRLRPHVLHTFMMKPIVYGTFAGRLLGVGRIINTYLGLGTLFIHETLSMRLVRGCVSFYLRALSLGGRVLHVVQNDDDAASLIKSRVAPPAKIHVQCSVGVNVTEYPRTPEPSSPPLIFALVGRMLWDKGVREFVEAARLLNLPLTRAQFWLVGTPDPGSRHSVEEDTLRAWHEEGVIVYKGFQDTKTLWARAHVAVLPSYREGLSRALLEAGVSGRCLITADAPGGRSLVDDQKTGLLVPVQDAHSLSRAMAQVLEDEALRANLSAASRAFILTHYTDEICANRTVDLYTHS